METKNRGLDYLERKKQFEERLAQQNKSLRHISHLRVIVFLVGTSSTYLLYREQSSLWGWMALVAVLIFVLLVKKYDASLVHKLRIEALVSINVEGLERVSGRWQHFTENGDSYQDEDHPYTQDLDIFGHGSLFQWLNTTTTYLGEKLLAQGLSHPTWTKEEIAQRQEAVSELAQAYEWCQCLQAEGLVALKKKWDPASLLAWVEERTGTRLLKGITSIRWLPLVTGLVALYAFWIPLIPIGYPIILLVVQLIIALASGLWISPRFAAAVAFKADLRGYVGLIERISEQDFQSAYLQGITKNYQGVRALGAIRRLSSVVDYTDLRYSNMYIVINTLLLWDFHCLVALEKWKETWGSQLGLWLEGIGRIEALASLAIIPRDNPRWSFPVIEDELYIKGDQIGHPLIGQNERVTNSFDLAQPGSIWIITGSNMSGKSTFLRTVGINLVLAYNGAPVCADEFRCAILPILCSMRTHDNLASRISSFYAELLRIKQIVQASHENASVFFLIDEIFKGTNSNDRLVGAMAVVRALSETGAMGLISTHDLELGELGNKPEHLIANYHFQEQYRNGEISFDFKLQPGVSTSTNALWLMRMVGITVPDQPIDPLPKRISRR